MSYLHYLCLFAHSDVEHILCCGFFYFVCLRLVSCVPIVTSFSGLSFFLLPLRYSLTFMYVLL